MPGLMATREEYADAQPLKGARDHRLAAHDGADRGPDRDARRARRRGALGQLQHLLDPGPRRRRDRGRRRARSSPGRARRSRSTGGAPSRRSPGPTARARTCSSTTAATPRCSCTRAPSSRRPAPCRTPRRPTPRSSRSSSQLLQRTLEDDPQKWTRIAEGIKGVTEETTTGVHRLYEMHGAGHAAVPGDQRQRLGDQVEVRQPLRLPPLAGRRHQPRAPT